MNPFAVSCSFAHFVVILHRILNKKIHNNIINN